MIHMVIYDMRIWLAKHINSHWNVWDQEVYLQSTPKNTDNNRNFWQNTRNSDMKYK